MDIDKYIASTINSLEKLADSNFKSQFELSVKLLSESIFDRKTILVCGNGGSYADAQHIAGELVNYFTIRHIALPVIALGANGAVLSAWSNDHSFEEQFAREVEAYGTRGSTLIGITTSGKSKNINLAFMRAKSLGMNTIALTSKKAIPFLSPEIDAILSVPAEETHKIQECHIVIYHALCAYIEESLLDEFKK